MPGLFVTATGTDVGKTYVSAGLLRAARRAGLATDALKPVLSGYATETMRASDSALLIEATGCPVTQDAVAAVSPWRFAAPLSPDMAAALEGRCIPYDALVAACRAFLGDPARPNRLALVEGVGGVMVPLDRAHTILDLMAALAVPILLVSATGLGAISHCLTAVAALRGRGIAPHAIVLNAHAPSPVPLAMTKATIADHCPGMPVLCLTRDATAAAFDDLLAALRLDPPDRRGEPLPVADEKSDRISPKTTPGNAEAM